MTAHRGSIRTTFDPTPAGAGAVRQLDQVNESTKVGADPPTEVTGEPVMSASGVEPSAPTGA
jgi:hypothetical protein